MTQSARDRIVTVFDEELRSAPVPPGLRPLSVRAAVAATRPRSNQPLVLALVAAFVLIALIASLVIGSHLLRTTAPAHTGSTMPPPPRGDAAAAFDKARGVMVLFGGSAYGPAGSELGDTWTWDGTYWVQQHASVSPQPRYDAAMAYDDAHRDIVLFSGLGEQRTPFADTWIWNGAAWRQLHPAHSPAYGYSWQRPEMAFDPVSRKVLVHGFTENYKPQTWAWDGSDWMQLPTAGFGNAGVPIFDGGNRLLAIAASAEPVGARPLFKTWSWSGATWTVVDTPYTPPIDLITSSAYDTRTGQLVVVAGDDTWTWTAPGWSRQHPSLQPPAGYMAYVPTLGEVVSFGDVLSNSDNRTFAWDGRDWKLTTPGTTTPGANARAKGGYHAVMTPSQAAALVTASVTNTRPVLLPKYLPAVVYDASVDVTADDFSIRYQSDLRDKSIDFGIVVANPPPGSPHAKDTLVRFRNALPMKYLPRGYAEYFVYDTSDPLSNRWLMWIEPGSTPNWSGGVPYFLAAQGLTDAEFWQVANSLE